jgi:hypothetical protein
VTAHIDPATGEKHFHAAWFRFDAERECVIDPGLFKVKLREEARFIEYDFGLRRLDNRRQPHDRARAAKRVEFEQSRRLDTDNRKIRNAILDAWEKSDGGRAFSAAMQAQGNELTNGDRRNCFVVIDRAGGYHALNKALTGKTLAEIEARFADLDRSTLRNATVVSREREQRQPAREKRSQTFERNQLDAAARAEAEQRKAAIGRTDDIRPDAAKARQKVKHWRDAPAERQEKPLGKTAGEIRLAWSLTRSGQQFAQEIERRGLQVVYVSRERAEASHRAHAFAKAAARQSRALKEGFGVVDARGNVTRIDQRTTGDLWEEIQKRLGGIDKDALLTVDQARDLMRHRNREEFREKMQAEREKARPPSFIEQKIVNCENRARISGSVAERDGQTVTLQGAEAFAAALDKAGIAIVRVTPEDVQALDGLRREEELARLASDVNREARKSRHFDRLDVDDIAAVDKRGNVYRLNPAKLDLAGIEAGLIEAGQAISSTSSTLPGVTEARAGFEIRAATTAALWQERRENNQARAAMYSEARDTQREIRQTTAPVTSTVRGTVQTAERTLFKSAGGAISAAAAILGSVADKIGGLFDFLAGPTAPPTREEAEGQERAAAERQMEAAELAAIQEREEARDWQQHAEKTQQQERNLSFAQRYGTPPTAEAQLGREHDDERERGRELER